MPKTLSNIVDCVLIAFGVTISIETIESILGVIILVIQIVWIITKLIINIYEKIKAKQYDQIEQDVNDAIENLNHLHDTKGDQK